MNGIFIKIKAKIRFKISSIKKSLLFVFLMTFEKFWDISLSILSYDNTDKINSYYIFYIYLHNLYNNQGLNEVITSAIKMQS